MRVLFVALALALAASAAAQPVTMQMAVESINTQTADADGRFVGVAAGGFMDGEDPLTVTYTRVPYPLGGDVAPDLNPTPGAFNGALVDVEGQAYVVLNQRGEDIKNTDGTANRFAMHAFTFTAPIFLPRNSIAITDLDFDHVGANGFHDAFALIVMDEAGNMVNLQGTTPSELEGTEGQEGLGVMEYTAAFPGADIGDIIETDGPDFSQFTELISYTNARDPTNPDPQLDPNGERGHDNTNNGVSFRTRARDGFPDGLRAIFVVYWNTFADTADENGQGICVRDGEFFLEAQADGDPHMVGFMGQHFNVLGEGGSVYNLVSTPHMQYNARFNSTQFTHKGKHATLISEMGVMVGDNHVRVFFPSAQSEELVMEVNGERIASDDHRMIMLSEDGEEWVMRTPGEERHVVIVTKAFHFNVHGQLQRLRHLDDGVKLVDWVSGSTAHGLLGQTANAAKVQKDQKEFVADFDWPWYLDGSLADYVVADGIFGTEFTYNQYEAL